PLGEHKPGAARPPRITVARSGCRLKLLSHYLMAEEGPFDDQDRSEPPSIPVKQPNQPQQPPTSSRADIEACLDQVRMLNPAVKSGERGRLISALDATMSRQPTWDQACHLQAEMFREAAAVGGLDLQLVYYRGLGECRASAWIAEPKRFGELMSRIECRGGQTQIVKILAHARRENDRRKVAALVFVGDAMEETLDKLCADAGELALRGIPAFMFQGVTIQLVSKPSAKSRD